MWLQMNNGVLAIERTASTLGGMFLCDPLEKYDFNPSCSWIFPKHNSGQIPMLTEI